MRATTSLQTLSTLLLKDRICILLFCHSRSRGCGRGRGCGPGRGRGRGRGPGPGPGPGPSPGPSPSPSPSHSLKSKVVFVEKTTELWKSLCVLIVPQIPQNSFNQSAKIAKKFGILLKKGLIGRP